MQSHGVMCSVAGNTKRESYLNLSKKTIKSNVAQFFLARLLVLLASHSCFCLGGLVDLIIGLTVSLAIDDAVSIVGKVAVGLSR